MKLDRPQTSALALPLVLLVLSACGSDDSMKQAKAPQATETTYGSTTSMTSAQPSGATPSSLPEGSMNGASNTTNPPADTSATSGMGASSPGGALTATFTDAEIASIIATINAGEVEEGKVAQKKAKDAKVKRFAATMVNHHQSSTTKGNALMKKINLTPSENATSRELASDGKSTIESLQSQSGTDFDKAYIDAQVREHQKVLSMLDDKLIPQTKSSELKSYLQAVRSTVDTHLREAMEIQKGLTK